VDVLTGMGDGRGVEDGEGVLSGGEPHDTKIEQITKNFKVSTIFRFMVIAFLDANPVIVDSHLVRDLVFSLFLG